MDAVLSPDNPDLKRGLFTIFRDFFGKAEKRRRWSLDDIPWDGVNKNINPSIGFVVESFCAVELYLPDYIAQALPMIRSNRAWSSFHINWGYEESKHSLAMADWLVRARIKTPEQLAEIEKEITFKIWDPPQDSGVAMLIYAMCQELATFLHYRNLRHQPDVASDPALSKILDLIAIDERAHHNFYRRVTQLFLEMDREATLNHLSRILQTFAMPAVHLFADCKRREAAIRSLKIFDEEVFYKEVYMPVLDVLGVKRQEVRNRLPNMKGRTTVAS